MTLSEKGVDPILLIDRPPTSVSAVSHYHFLTKEVAGYTVVISYRERVTMVLNLSRNRGRFAGFAVRTLFGFSLLAGCITTASASGNSNLFTGIVFDASGSAVPAATVNATRTAVPTGVALQIDAVRRVK